MAELRQKMAEMHGKVPVQMTFITPMPERKPWSPSRFSAVLLLLPDAVWSYYVYW